MVLPDSTFLFPWAIREYAGNCRCGIPAKRWESIEALIDCGLLKDTDGDGLIDHGFTGTAENAYPRFNLDGPYRQEEKRKRCSGFVL